MTYAQRLAKQLEQAPSRTVYNAQQKPVIDWQREANSKRGIR